MSTPSSAARTGRCSVIIRIFTVFLGFCGETAAFSRAKRRSCWAPAARHRPCSASCASRAQGSSRSPVRAKTPMTPSRGTAMPCSSSTPHPSGCTPTTAHGWSTLICCQTAAVCSTSSTTPRGRGCCWTRRNAASAARAACRCSSRRQNAPPSASRVRRFPIPAVKKYYVNFKSRCRTSF